MKSLYNEYEMLNDDGNRLCANLQTFTEQFITVYAENYPLREIESVMVDDIHVMICEMLLRRSVNLWKAKNNA